MIHNPLLFESLSFYPSINNKKNIYINEKKFFLDNEIKNLKTSVE